MHAFDFMRLKPAERVKPVYAVVGEEPFLRSEVVRSIVQATAGESAAEQAIERLEGAQARLADVLDTLRQLPMFSEHRIVLLDDADDFVSAHRRELEAYVERPSGTGTLVLRVKTWPATTRLAKQFAASGHTIECKPPAASTLATWAVSHARREHHAKLDSDAARMLVDLLGCEVGMVASEVAKLAAYVGEARHIRCDDVARMVGGTHVETIWKILDAATTGRGGEALLELDRLMASGEHPVALLAAMTASLRKVHRAGMLRLQKIDAREACRTAGIPPFALENTLKQHTHLGPRRVARLPQLLLDTDIDLKGGSQLSPRAVLERLVVELARPRTD